MKKAKPSQEKNSTVKKGYNEKNPGQPEGAFLPASHAQQPTKNTTKSNTADKKEKEDQN
jgi:hypothetical protein